MDYNKCFCGGEPKEWVAYGKEVIICSNPNCPMHDANVMPIAWDKTVSNKPNFIVLMTERDEARAELAKQIEYAEGLQHQLDEIFTPEMVEAGLTDAKSVRDAALKWVDCKKELKNIFMIADCLENNRVWCDECMSVFEECEVAENQTSCIECHSVDSLVKNESYNIGAIYAKLKALLD